MVDTGCTEVDLVLHVANQNSIPTLMMNKSYAVKHMRVCPQPRSNAYRPRKSQPGRTINQKCSRSRTLHKIALTPAIPRSLTSVYVRMKGGLPWSDCSYSSRAVLWRVSLPPACIDITLQVEDRGFN